MIGWWAVTAHAGAWTRDFGELYAKAGADFTASVRADRPSGSPATEDGYVGQQYGLYIETGLIPWWKGQLSVSLPVVIASHHAVYDDAFGTDEVRATTLRSGDLRVAVQAALLPELPLAVSVDVKVPTYANGTVGADYPVYERLFPKPGDGQIDIGAMLYAGGSVQNGSFAEAGVGFVHRTERFVGWDPRLELSDGFRFIAKAGRPVGSVLPIIALEGTISPDPTRFTRSTVSASVSALVEVAEHLAMEPRLTGDLWTRNTFQAVGGGLGISYRR